MKKIINIDHIQDLFVRRILGEVRWSEHLLRRGRINKNDYYDHLTELIIARVLSGNSICVDVGCHMGSILKLMMKHSPGGTFFAFEPIPDLFRYLEEHFSLPNVHLFKMALSNEKGMTTFNYVSSNPGYSGLKRRKYDQPEEKDEQIQVQTGLLDEVLSGYDHNRIALMKIDVEGAELLVLEGGRKRIAKDRPVIIFEHGLGGADCYGKGPGDIYALLCDECGLKISLLEDWLLGRRPLDRPGFSDQFHKGKNYYFVAHP